MVSSNAIKRLISLLPFIFVAVSISILFVSIVSLLLFNINQSIAEFSFRSEFILYVFQNSLLQSFISSFLVIVIGFQVAKALFRKSNFLGRSIILNYLNISYALSPVIFTVALINLYEKEGWFAEIFSKHLGLNVNDYLFGIDGVILAHLVFSLPFAIRAFYISLNNTSIEILKLSQQLGLSFLKSFFLIEFPAIKKTLSYVFAYTFIFSFTSFAIVLILGGGVLSSTTFEVSIFEAIKLDLNFSFATLLSLIQVVICLLFMLITLRFDDNNYIIEERRDSFCSFNFKYRFLTKSFDSFAIVFFLLLCVLPLISIIKEGFDYKIVNFLYSQKFNSFLGYSLLIAFMSALFSLFLAFSIISGAFYTKYNFKKDVLARRILYLGNFKMVISVFVFINAVLLFSSNFNYMFKYAKFFLIVITALSSLPIVINILHKSSMSFTKEEINLCIQNQIHYWNFIKYLYYPKIKKHLGYAFSFASIFALGDLSLVALINANELTLPNFLYANLRNYQADEASIIAFILLFISFFIFWIVKELMDDN